MELVAGLMGLAMLIWAFVLVRYHNVLIGSAIFLIATSVFPPEFAQINVAGLSLTVDRAWLLVLILQYGYDLWTGKAKPRSPKGSDIWLFLFLAWLVLRTITTPIGEEISGQPSTVMHLINGYLTPTFLFLLIRHSEIRPGTLWPAVVIILVFGVYLSLTAVLEITKQWSLVFPSFIGDPTLGIHFGRARGPMLQSVRLGMCLNFCLVVLWVFPVWLYARQRWAWLLAACLTPLFMLAILLTYTRSIWLGAGAIVVILLATLLRGKARTLGLGALVFSVAIGGVLVGPNLVAFKREYGEAETLESTRMRGAFAYVSMEMFKDRPLAGFGFNQFQVQNRPYLDDRTTNIRLESIRGYVHHNSYLSLLVDLGLVGALLFVVASIGLVRNAWVNWTHPLSSGVAKSSAVLCFCMVAVHAIQMAFHEVSFSSIEYTILMISLGLSQVFRDDLVEATANLGSHDS
ncbi:MAG: O-antigen ligase family protein [Pirellula sp.]|nr:O-antigen ligase family protein [Pirellula sp.]